MLLKVLESVMSSYQGRVSKADGQIRLTDFSAMAFSQMLMN